MKYFIITYGCQMNRSDSEKITTRLNNLGHKAVRAASTAKSLAEADLIVINACSVRQSAIHRVFGQIENHKHKKLIVAGCLLPSDKKLLIEKGVEIWHPDEYFCLAPQIKTPFSALVPIMTGCNNFCSYCVVPFTRGAEKSRPTQEIISEIKNLLENGAKEITLIGQNVNSYRDRKIDFPDLLKKINDLPDNFWLSFVTSHPKDMSQKLIKTAPASQKVIPYIHLPIQSGDDNIIKKMNRRYTVAHYEKLVKNIRGAFKKYRGAFPPVAISTDIIVGFPGETKKQFQNTARLMKKINFDMAYLAQYSPRAGSAASRLKDDVPKKEKKRRERLLNDILTKTALKNNKKYLGKKIAVLIKEIKNGYALGKTATGKTVRLKAQKLAPGDLIKITVNKVSAWGLSGKTEK